MSILDKIGQVLGMTPDANGVDEQKALAFTQDRWNDLKNSFVVWHQ